MNFWEPDLRILEDAFYVKYLGTSNRDTLLWIDISGTTYIYSRAANADTIKEIARKFEKLMQYGPGRALAWLKKNTELRGKVPTSQAKSKMKESKMKCGRSIDAEVLIENLVNRSSEYNEEGFDDDDEVTDDDFDTSYYPDDPNFSIGA